VIIEGMDGQHDDSDDALMERLRRALDETPPTGGERVRLRSWDNGLSYSVLFTLQGRTLSMSPQLARLLADELWAAADEADSLTE
jgi:hypothetical protein